MTIKTMLQALSQTLHRHALLLFVVLGLCLFAVEQLRHGPTGALDARLATNPAALEEEALYREALALGLDQGDLIVRRRLVQKMRQLLELDVVVAEPDEVALRAWVAADPARYGLAPRLDLDHRFLAAGRKTDAGGSDPHPAGTRLQGVDARQLERLFGSALAARIQGLPEGDWHGPLDGPLGQHFLRITARVSPTPDWPAVLALARRDYLVEARQAQARLALERLVEQHASAS